MSKSLFVGIAALAGLVILALGGLAAAQDEGLPVVVCPEDIPGADVIVFLGDSYTIDVSRSYDDDGIAYFEIAFQDGGVDQFFTTTTGIVTYTFQYYGQTWVTATAYDVLGNAGTGQFSIDVVELVTSDLIFQDTTASIDHSYYLRDSNLIVDNSQLRFADGAGAGAGGGSGADVTPDMLAESLTNDGDLAGHWEPYYWYSYWRTGNNYYGEPIEDEDTKLSGEKSISLTGGSYRYGFEYHFDENQDLTEYDALTFWLHSDRPDYYNWMYYCYFYGSHDYSSTYGYAYILAGTYYLGGYAMYKGWCGYTVPLDTNNIGYYYSYNMAGLSSVACIRFYMYYTTTPYTKWIDCVGLYETEWGDEITESATPVGELGGRWSGGTTDTHHYVGENSVRFDISYSSYHDFYYYFDRPVDLSKYQMLRYFLKIRAGGNDVYYSYYWGYSYTQSVYIYDTYGRYCYYYIYPNTYFYYGYQKWYAHSLPWGTESAYYDSGIDMTKVSYFRIANYYTYYIYPQATPYYLYIDGLEWKIPGGASTGGRTDTVPITIYVDNGDTSITGNSEIHGSPITGARILTDGGAATFQDSLFDSLWGTQYPGVHNAYGIMGGLEVYGDVTAKSIDFINCKGPGMALFDGKMTLDPDTIQFSGTALKVKGAPQLILGVSERATAPVTIDVTKWDFSNNVKGSGLMVMLDECTVKVDVLVHDNTISANKWDGLILSNWGGTGDFHIKVYEQLIEDNKNYGIYFWAGMGEWTPGTTATLEMTKVVVEDSGFRNVQLTLGAGALDIDVDIYDCWLEGSGGSGLGHLWEGFFGKARYNLSNITVTDNDGNGVDFITLMTPYVDEDGNTISPVSDVEVMWDGVVINGNAGIAVMEDLSALDDAAGGVSPPWSWTGPTRTTLMLNFSIMNSFFGENAGDAWSVGSAEGWVESNLYAERRMVDSSMEDNRGTGVLIEVSCDLLRGDAEISDIWWFENVYFTDNLAGIVHDLGADNPGYYSEVHLLRCELRGSEAEAIFVTGGMASDGMRDYGISNVKGVEYYVDTCWINSPVRTYLMGANDWGRDDWEATMGLTFWNNTYDNEAGVDVRLGANQLCEDFTAWCDIGRTRYLKSLAGDGFKLEVYGGQNLDLDLLVRDQRFLRPPGSGLDVKVGLLWPGPEPHKISGPISISNVTVKDAGSNGINLTYDIAQVIGSNVRAFLDATGLNVDGAVIGIYATGINGKVYLSTIEDCSDKAVYIYDALFDFFGCEIGPINVDNVRVFTKGAARIWYDMGIDVKWASGARVVGAVVSVEDNTYSTLGVDTMGADAAIPFGYINSYTILPDSVYSKSPFTLRATYLGLITERLEDINSNAVIDLVMVDDVMPRLTVTTPADGTAQTERTITVKGFAWDLHSGLDVVEVSLDGDEWLGATREQEFTIMLEDVPEGDHDLMVRALDQAGNAVVKHVRVVVDTTPPVIQIIEPTLDVFSTRDPTLRVTGVTEADATVAIAGTRVSLDMTLFSTVVTLNEGPNEVSVVASDMLGNTAVHIISVMLDTVSPPLIILEPAANAVLGKVQVTVVGQTEPGAMVRVNGAPVANLMGSFTGRSTLAEGPSIIVVEAEDSIGNVRTIQVPVTIDTTKPWLNIMSPAPGEVYGVSGIPVEGWVEAGTSVFVNDAKVTVDNGHFSTIIVGSEGTFTVSVLAVDLAGNEMVRTMSVVVDMTAPRLVLASPADGAITKEDHIMLVGELLWDRETFREVTFMMNDVFIPFASDGTFRERVSLGEGSNMLTFVVSDNVGNSMTTQITVVRDSTAPFLLVEPTPTFMHDVWNKPATYFSMVYIEGDTEPGAKVTVEGAEIDVGPDGHFNVSVSLADILSGQEVSHTPIRVIARDAAGNEVAETVDVYRLKKAEDEKGFAKYEAAQWWALVLSIIVLVLAILTVWLLLRYAERQRLREAEAGGR